MITVHKIISDRCLGCGITLPIPFTLIMYERVSVALCQNCAKALRSKLLSISGEDIKNGVKDAE